MIKTINGWRAVFALIIVLFHVGVAGLEELTWAGVTFFFMASGMLLSMKYPFKSLDVNSYKRFAWRHAAKLYPLHWLVLALWLLVMALAGALVIKPLALVVTFWVSTYEAVPLGFPCRMEMRTPTAWLVIRLFPASLTTAWYENFCGACATTAATAIIIMARVRRSFFILF